MGEIPFYGGWLLSLIYVDFIGANLDESTDSRGCLALRVVLSDRAGSPLRNPWVLWYNDHLPLGTTIDLAKEEDEAPVGHLDTVNLCGNKKVAVDANTAATSIDVRNLLFCTDLSLKNLRLVGLNTMFLVQLFHLCLEGTLISYINTEPLINLVSLSIRKTPFRWLEMKYLSGLQILDISHTYICVL